MMLAIQRSFGIMILLAIAGISGLRLNYSGKCIGKRFMKLSPMIYVKRCFEYVTIRYLGSIIFMCYTAPFIPLL